MPKRLDPALIEKIRNLASSGLSTKEIGEIVGKSAKAIQKIYRRYDIHGLPQAAQGHRNHFWKGGKTIDKNGYILIKVLEHPYANNAGYVREHRLIMENKLKRYLLPTEVVHHLDGNKQNNSIENLELFQSNGEHLHQELLGKCPNWTPEGYAKICAKRGPYKAGKPSSSQKKLETCD